jgi:hypothetical protein
MAVTPLIHKGNVERIGKILTWTAPAIAIPGLRYTQDSKTQRKELFVRDASTYSIGTVTFFGTEYIVKKGLDHFKLIRNLDQRALVAFLVGLTANLLYAGIGAVRFSKAFSQYQAKKAAEKNEARKTLPPSVSQTQFSASQPRSENLSPWPTNTVGPLLQPLPRMEYFV